MIFKPQRTPSTEPNDQPPVSQGRPPAVLLNVNKNEYAQINYGTGKDVSDEFHRGAPASAAAQRQQRKNTDLEVIGPTVGSKRSL
jgi:hypothetical protein